MAFPVSGNFVAAIRGGQYQSVVTADVYYSGVFVVSVPVTGGSITMDRTANTRRSCSVTIGHPSFIALFASSALSPYGTELRISMGIRYPDQSTEMVPMGRYTIYSISWSDGDGSIPTVVGYDYGKKLDDAVLAHAIDRSGLFALDVLDNAIQDVLYTDIAIDDHSLDVNYRLPGGSIFDNNRWDFINQVLAPMGSEGFFDTFGNFIIQQVPSVDQFTTDDDCVWTVDAGEIGVMIDAQRTVSREGTYNLVTAIGSSTSDTGDPPIGYAADTNPTSPTYWGPAASVPNGPFVFTPFGQVVLRYENSAMTTSAQCTAAAKAELRKVVGLAKSLTLDTVPNISLDVGDIIKVEFTNDTPEYHLIDVISIDLGMSSFSCQTRSTIGQLPVD